MNYIIERGRKLERSEGDFVDRWREYNVRGEKHASKRKKKEDRNDEDKDL